jgi:hypothetical protein
MRDKIVAVIHQTTLPSKMHSRTFGVALFSLATIFNGGAVACDELASRLLSAHLGPAVQSLGCSALGRLDVADHKLESVCYTSSGPTSYIEIVASLICRTSAAAVVQASASERVTADVQIHDCSVQRINLRTSGIIGRVLVEGLDAKGRVREALQAGLNKLCSQ